MFQVKELFSKSATITMEDSVDDQPVPTAGWIDTRVEAEGKSEDLGGGGPCFEVGSVIAEDSGGHNYLTIITIILLSLLCMYYCMKGLFRICQHCSDSCSWICFLLKNCLTGIQLGCQCCSYIFSCFGLLCGFCRQTADVISPLRQEGPEDGGGQLEDVDNQPSSVSVGEVGVSANRGIYPDLRALACWTVAEDPEGVERSRVEDLSDGIARDRDNKTGVFLHPYRFREGFQ